MIVWFRRKSKRRKLLRELREAIAQEVPRFALDVKQLCSEVPELVELNEMLLRLGALAFFLHTVDRLSFRTQNEELHKLAFVNTALVLSRMYGEVISGMNAGYLRLRQELRALGDDLPADAVPGSTELASIPAAEKEMLIYLNLHGSQYGKASKLVGKAFDRDSAAWLAACAIADEVDHPKEIRLIPVIYARLIKGVINLQLEQRVKAIERFI
jgi:hypothetical protein